MVWALTFNDSAMYPASDLPAAGTGVSSFNIRLKFRIDVLDGSSHTIWTNKQSNPSSDDSLLVLISSSNELFIQCGGASQRITDNSIQVNTYYDLEIDATGLDTVTDNTTQGTLTATLNGTQIGTFTPKNSPFFWTEKVLSAIGGFPLGDPTVTQINSPFRGSIYEVGWTYNGNSHYWTAAASDRSNTGSQPVLTATQGAVDILPFAASDFLTDGSDFNDLPAGADTTAPAWTSDPALSATTDTGHSFQFTLDENSTAYAVRLASGATAPSAAQIIAGTDAADVALAASAKWSGAVTAATQKTATFSGGSISTTYNYYFAAQDAASNNSIVKTATATTGAGSITVDSGTVTAGSVFSGTYTGIGSLSSPITLTDTAGNSINVAITDDADGTYSNATMPALPTSGSAASVLFGTLTISGSA